MAPMGNIDWDETNNQQESGRMQASNLILVCCLGDPRFILKPLILADCSKGCDIKPPGSICIPPIFGP